ncbi:hypothetical protein ABKN59_010623 [Abortiporus biennis]
MLLLLQFTTTMHGNQNVITFSNSSDDSHDVQLSNSCPDTLPMNFPRSASQEDGAITRCIDQFIYLFCCASNEMKSAGDASKTCFT